MDTYDLLYQKRTIDRFKDLRQHEQVVNQIMSILRENGATLAHARYIFIDILEKIELENPLK